MFGDYTKNIGTEGVSCNAATKGKSCKQIHLDLQSKFMVGWMALILNFTCGITIASINMQG